MKVRFSVTVTVEGYIDREIDGSPDDYIDVLESEEFTTDDIIITSHNGVVDDWEVLAE